MPKGTGVKAVQWNHSGKCQVILYSFSNTNAYYMDVIKEALEPHLPNLCSVPATYVPYIISFNPHNISVSIKRGNKGLRENRMG